MSTNESKGIAIVGMAGRFPGAPDIASFWRMVCEGREGITWFSDEALQAAGVAAATLEAKDYVKANGRLAGAENFDAAFFGYSAREAEYMDPQHRNFLEVAWSALEDAGYDPRGGEASVGVFAGCSQNSYLLFNVAPRLSTSLNMEALQASIGGDKDFLSTRVSYKLNLTGPSFTVQTACSTSLVAVHLAANSLLLGECDVALAGGSAVRAQQDTGYHAQEGGILSPDGHCRAFSADARGTVPSNGVAAVVLKRVEDAVRDGDSIYAVIRGTAINNDGAGKAGFTAPSVDGQAGAIAEAMAVADVTPESISYVETHGTGTVLGDPIEIEALRTAHGSPSVPCWIGSLKSNLGHMDAAAGVGGLIKAALALKHRQLPPSLNFSAPNPQIPFAGSRFRVNTELRAWDGVSLPRRAGVSSFGVGGTNVHVILEEAPVRAASLTSARSPHLMALSAKTESALDAMTLRLGEYLKDHPDVNLADVAATLANGRSAFEYRSVFLAASSPEAPIRGRAAGSGDIVFLFPGQGAQHVGMAENLYRQEPVFQRAFDVVCDELRPHVGLDIRPLLFGETANAEALSQTAVTQPVMFAVEYALAKLWQSWGVTPSAMLGHSIGEYTAACLADVFSLADAARLIAARGRLVQRLPEGAMTAVRLSLAALEPFLDEDTEIAALNGPRRTVVAGPELAIARLEEKLAAAAHPFRRLKTSHAFHTRAMSAAIPELRRVLATMELRAPKIPVLSNVTGRYLTAEQAKSPDYWCEHLVSAVRFAQGVLTLVEQGPCQFLELGPGQSLSPFVKEAAPSFACLASLPHATESANDAGVARLALGKLWVSGSLAKLPNLYAGETRRKVSLPAYPFEGKRFWIEPVLRSLAAAPELAVAVPEPVATASARPPSLGEYVAPATDLEKLIVQVWEEMFGTSPIGINDGFFEIGGDSIMAAQIVVRLKESLPIPIPIDILFTESTVAKLAAYLDRTLDAELENSLHG